MYLLINIDFLIIVIKKLNNVEKCDLKVTYIYIKKNYI